MLALQCIELTLPSPFPHPGPPASIVELRLLLNLVGRLLQAEGDGLSVHPVGAAHHFGDCRAQLLDGPPLAVRQAAAHVDLVQLHLQGAAEIEVGAEFRQLGANLLRRLARHEDAQGQFQRLRGVLQGIAQGENNALDHFQQCPMYNLRKSGGCFMEEKQPTTEEISPAFSNLSRRHGDMGGRSRDIGA